MDIISRAILQNASLTPLLENLDGGRLPALISGLSPVHRAHLAAALHLETGRPLFVAAPDTPSAEAMARDLRALLGADVPILDSRDLTLYSADTVSRQAEQRRLAAFDSLLRGLWPVTVCTAPALMQRTIPPEALAAASFTMSMQSSPAPEELERRLLLSGYSRTERVEGAGQFARRGGIIDFFSPAEDLPVRAEFWGDDVDSMGLFDPESQRRVENIQQARIIPAAETLPGLSEGGGEALGGRLRALAKRVNRHAVNFDSGRLVDILQEDAERLQNGAELTAADRYMALIYPRHATALDYIPADALVLMDQPAKVAERARSWQKLVAEDVKQAVKTGLISGPLGDLYTSWELCCERLADFPVVMADAFTLGRYPLEPRFMAGITAKQLSSYAGSAEAAVGDVAHYVGRGFGVVVLAEDQRRAGVLVEAFSHKGVEASFATDLSKLPSGGRCVVTLGSLSAGMEYPDIKLAILTDTQFIRAGVRKKKKPSASRGQRLGSYDDLSVGDLVVHEIHGIGRFAGIIRMPVDGAEKDYIKIAYAGTDSLYVPATQLDMVSKYIGGGGEERQVRLSKLGGADWTRTKSRAKAAAKELATDLIALYAERQRRPGHAFSPDSPWQTEFEDAFEYPETDDQLRCIREIKADMEKPVPMDRLLCGDVGFGKTEVALRAVMKCILDGRQAAILVPTTVLAQQHFQTATQRFFGFPIRIEVMSRFRSPAQMRRTTDALKSGECDLVIGTHRLLQKDVKFKNLGLLVVDEEQRFGVGHKEHIKEMSKQVDVLTLSATPIPRTLNMAMSGLRDMSVIEEPPQDRLPVQTFVMEHDWGVVADAIRREVERGGQVYYLHNRVENIDRCAGRLSKLLPGVSIGVAHGRMDQEELSSVMESVSNGETQVLVCTTIVETGIDIPNVNTLIIEDADKLGLAQLHQIRGRVGRSSRRASAYLTFRKDKVLTEIAEKRLAAIREFAGFNSGFRIAMRDLEIRGAGSLLGAQQSGNLSDVGYDMYLKLLEEAVLEERGESVPVRTDCAADIAVSANIPDSYVPSAEQRMDLYRRIALIRSEADADDMTDELIDRFGEPPRSVNDLIQVSILRSEAGAAGIRDISQKDDYLRFAPAEFDMERISALYARPEFKGRVKVEAGQTPRFSLRLKNRRRSLDEARALIAAYAGKGKHEN